MKIQFKIVVLFIISVLCSASLYSQSKDYRQPVPLVKYNSNVNSPLTSKELALIKEVYGDQAEKEILSRPQRVKDIKHLLRNRIEIKLVPGGDLKPCPLLSEVSLFDAYVSTLTRDVNFNPHDFNPLKYNLNFYSRNAALYKVDNTNYFIIIKSQHQ